MNEVRINEIDWDRCSPGYCQKCREMEISVYNTVLDQNIARKMNLDYFLAHTECCEKAECKHPFWYPPASNK